MAKLVWRVKLVAELGSGTVSRCRLDGSASISVQAGAGLHPYVDGGIKGDENISILGTCAEAECHRR
jgi:hypothetical protein